MNTLGWLIVIVGAIWLGVMFPFIFILYGIFIGLFLIASSN